MLDNRSSLVASGRLRFNGDGTVDERCAAVRDGSVLINFDGSVSNASKAFNDDTLALKSSIVAKQSELPSPQTTASAQPDGRSASVRNGSVLLTKDGAVDKRCEAYRSGTLLTSSTNREV